MTESRPRPAHKDVRVIAEERLIDTGFSVVRRTTVEYPRFDGTRQVIKRETYDRGNGAGILLFDPSRGCVLLVRQFRYPAYANPAPQDAGRPDCGWLIEVPAGLLDDHTAAGLSQEEAIRREAEEEAGVSVAAPRRILDLYTSPGSITERLALFVSTYSARDRTGLGGGLEAEGEDIAVIEPTLDEALAMVGRGEIADAKTIILLFWAKLHPEALTG